MKLMSEADTIEMKQRLARTLKVVIEYADQQIVPHTQMIAEVIPTLCLYTLLVGDLQLTICSQGLLLGKSGCSRQNSLRL